VVRERVRPPGAGPLRKLLTWALFRGMGPLEVVEKLRRRVPRDVRIQQAKVARAEALVFIAPVWFVGFPAILKGWIERVFTLGFAFSLTSAGWRGDIAGRRPLLRHRKALVISTTCFDEAAYRGGLGEAMRLLIDEFALRYPGIERVEHEWFYAVIMADEDTRRRYLGRAYRLGLEFDVRPAAVAASGLAGRSGGYALRRAAGGRGGSGRLAGSIAKGSTPGRPLRIAFAAARTARSMAASAAK